MRRFNKEGIIYGVPQHFVERLRDRFNLYADSIPDILNGMKFIHTTHGREDVLTYEYLKLNMGIGVQESYLEGEEYVLKTCYHFDHLPEKTGNDTLHRYLHRSKFTKYLDYNREYQDINELRAQF